MSENDELLKSRDAWKAHAEQWRNEAVRFRTALDLIAAQEPNEHAWSVGVARAALAAPRGQAPLSD